MYISRQCSEQQQLRTQPHSSLYHPWTYSKFAFAWKVHTPQHTRTHTNTRSDIRYLLTQADKYTFKCLLMWRRSVKPSAELNSNIIKMTRAASTCGDLKVFQRLWRDNVEEKCEDIVNRLLCDRWMLTAFKFCFQHILSPVKTLKRKLQFHHRNFSPVRGTLRGTVFSQQGPGS